VWRFNLKELYKKGLTFRSYRNTRPRTI